MRKQYFTMIALAAALLAAPRAEALAQAGAPNLRAAFGNTIMSTYPDGRQAELWLEADGSYHAKGRRGDDSNGAWRIKSGRLCLRQQQPLPAPFSFCTPMPGRFDRSWTAHAVTGEPIRVALVHGRVVGRTGPPRHA
jgi:hypothetical protein